jgi:hypothetical protein
LLLKMTNFVFPKTSCCEMYRHRKTIEMTIKMLTRVEAAILNDSMLQFSCGV